MSYTSHQEYLEDKVKKLSSALKVCHTSLSSYGSHPIIDKQVDKALKL